MPLEMMLQGHGVSTYFRFDDLGLPASLRLARQPPSLLRARGCLAT